MKNFDTVREKHFLRLHYREQVRSLSVLERRRSARAVARRVARWPVFQRAKSLGLFISMPIEIDTRPLIALARRYGKGVGVPVVFPDTGRMRFARLPRARSELRKNVYGIWEPRRPEWMSTPDLVFVPGAAFTADGHRLGSGAGYYDRFLDRHPRPVAVGIGLDEQMAKRLPQERHDQRLTGVLTPSRFYHG